MFKRPLCTRCVTCCPLLRSFTIAIPDFYNSIKSRNSNNRARTHHSRYQCNRRLFPANTRDACNARSRNHLSSTATGRIPRMLYPHMPTLMIYTRKKPSTTTFRIFAKLNRTVNTSPSSMLFPLMSIEILFVSTAKVITFRHRALEGKRVSFLVRADSRSQSSSVLSENI